MWQVRSYVGSHASALLYNSLHSVIITFEFVHTFEMTATNVTSCRILKLCVMTELKQVCSVHFSIFFF